MANGTEAEPPAPNRRPADTAPATGGHVTTEPATDTPPSAAIAPTSPLQTAAPVAGLTAAATASGQGGAEGAAAVTDCRSPGLPPVATEGAGAGYGKPSATSAREGGDEAAEEHAVQRDSCSERERQQQQTEQGCTEATDAATETVAQHGGVEAAGAEDGKGQLRSSACGGDVDMDTGEGGEQDAVDAAQEAEGKADGGGDGGAQEVQKGSADGAEKDAADGAEAQGPESIDAEMKDALAEPNARPEEPPAEPSAADGAEHAVTDDVAPNSTCREAMAAEPPAQNAVEAPPEQHAS
jgi:hypothetical protein